MATDFNAQVNAEIISEEKLTIASGKVANFAYDSEAYASDTVAGTVEYDYDQHQNIPLGSASVLNTDSSILDKGVRSQASSLTRMMLNHFLGRTSFNVNKLADHLKALLAVFKNFLKEGDNAWSPTIEYKVGDVIYVLSTLNYKQCKRTFVCIVDCPSANLPPVYTDGSLINTTYWKEIGNVFGGMEVNGASVLNGDLTVNGNITQSGTTYVTHAEQIYTKKDNIITREDATTGLASGKYSGIKVTNYDGNGTDGILAYRSDGTAVVGDYTEGNPPSEQLQPLLTRPEASDIQDGAPLVWDSAHKRAIGGSFASSPIITASSTTFTGVAISAGFTIKVQFASDISGTDDSTPLAFTYNNSASPIPVKVAKDGALVDVYAKEVQTNIFKYLQAYTTLELLYDGTNFIILGNPVVLSSEDYVIYASGSDPIAQNIPDYANATQVTFDNNNSYTASKNGWIMGFFVAEQNTLVANLNINGTVLARSQYGTWVDSNTIFARVKKGDVLTLTGNSLATSPDANSLKFVPQLQY